MRVETTSVADGPVAEAAGGIEAVVGVGDGSVKRLAAVADPTGCSSSLPAGCRRAEPVADIPATAERLAVGMA